MTSREALGRTIYGFRVAKGESAKSFAKNCNIGTRTLLNVEKGLTDPIFRTIKKIADYLGLPVKDLFCIAEYNMQDFTQTDPSVFENSL